MLGSHNSFTYGKPKDLLSIIISPWSKCQTKSIYDQFAEGVQVFDLRLKYHKPQEQSILDKFVVAHGLYNPEVDWQSDLSLLNDLASQKPIYLRIILEHTKHSIEAELQFKKLVSLLQSLYPHLNFTGGQIKADWSTIVSLPPLPADDHQICSSMHAFNLSKTTGKPLTYLTLFGHRFLFSLHSLIPTKWYSRYYNPTTFFSYKTSSQIYSFDHV